VSIELDQAQHRAVAWRRPPDDLPETIEAISWVAFELETRLGSSSTRTDVDLRRSAPLPLSLRTSATRNVWLTHATYPAASTRFQRNLPPLVREGMRRPDAELTVKRDESFPRLFERDGLTRLRSRRQGLRRVKRGMTEEDGRIKAALNVSRHDLHDIACRLLRLEFAPIGAAPSDDHRGAGRSDDRVPAGSTP
jgi:hypothetical protein